MGDAAVEERVRLGGGLVHVGVEGVAGEAGEMLDVGERDLAGGGDELVADLRAPPATCGTDGRRRCSASAPSIQRPVTAESRRGRALDGGALHVVLHAADAAHLLAAAGAAGAAMDEDRQRRAVAGRGLGAQAVADQDAAVEGGEAEDGLLGDGLVVGEDRGDEAALAAPGQRDGLVEVVVGHDGGDRAEGLDVVDGGLAQRLVGVEEDRVEEGAGLGVAGGDA